MNPSTNLTPAQFTAATGSAPAAAMTQAQLSAQNASRGITQTLPPVSQTQSATALNNQISGTNPGVQFPPAPGAPTAGVYANTGVPNPIPGAADIINAGATATPAEQKNTTLLEKVAQLIGSNKGKTTLTNEAENAAGVGGLKTIRDSFADQLTGFADQSAKLQLDAGVGGAIENKAQEGALGRGITAGGLAPLTAGELRKNQIQQASIAAQSLTTKAAFLAADRKYSDAKDVADKAADAQYEEEQNQINYQKALIEANAPQMNKEQKAQADLVTAQLDDRQRQLDQAKEDKKSIMAMAAAALQNHPNDAAVQYAVQQALAESNKQQPDLQAALSLVGKYQSDPNAVALQVGQLQAQRDAHAKAMADIAKTNAEIKGLNIGAASITNPAAAPYATALSTILGSAKFTKDQKTSLIQSINNGEDPFTVIKNQAKNIMGSSEATKLTSYEAADSAMRDLQKNIQAYYDGGGDTGLFSGTFEQTVNKLGTVKDPAKVALATQVAISLQAYRNAISGTAYSNQEGQQISAVFPGINKSHGLNDAIIQGRLQADSSIIDGIYGTALGSKTYQDLKAAQGGGSSTGTPKGSQSDSAYVESTLRKLGTTYQEVLNSIPAGQIGAIDNATGALVTMTQAEFDPKKYTHL